VRRSLSSPTWAVTAACIAGSKKRELLRPAALAGFFDGSPRNGQLRRNDMMPPSSAIEPARRTAQRSEPGTPAGMVPNAICA